jgi:hypothetical protein
VRNIKHNKTLCGQNAQFQYVKVGGTFNNNWGLKGYIQLGTAFGEAEEKTECIRRGRSTYMKLETDTNENTNERWKPVVYLIQFIPSCVPSHAEIGREREPFKLLTYTCAYYIGAMTHSEQRGKNVLWVTS